MRTYLLITLLIFLKIGIFAQSTTWNEYKLKEYWKINGTDDIEGIYENLNYRFPDLNNQTAVLKTSGGYTLIFLSGGSAFSNWKAGEIRGYLTPTATPNIFKPINYKLYTKEVYENLYIVFESIGMKIIWDSGKTSSFYLKLYPTESDKNSQNNSPSTKASGTGFGISSNGIIVTNYHVIDGANKIIVRGVNSDFNKTYNAKILVSDKNNDIAIIQIDDYGFSTIGTIPYTIKTSLGEVGENIFVLGYPLRSTMGDEIKLTNGIISSRTGFQGDVTSYQISAPVQPGNSGGPLFDKEGNLIGIINAKHTGAENASYGVKSSYLTGLIELLSSPPKLQTINLLKGKSLTQQVELAKKFVYIIETE